MQSNVSLQQSHQQTCVCVCVIQQVWAVGLLSSVLSGPPALIIPHRPHLQITYFGKQRGYYPSTFIGALSRHFLYIL